MVISKKFKDKCKKIFKNDENRRVTRSVALKNSELSDTTNKFKEISSVLKGIAPTPPKINQDSIEPPNIQTAFKIKDNNSQNVNHINSLTNEQERSSTPLPNLQLIPKISLGDEMVISEDEDADDIKIIQKCLNNIGNNTINVEQSNQAITHDLINMNPNLFGLNSLNNQTNTQINLNQITNNQNIYLISNQITIVNKETGEKSSPGIARNTRSKCKQKLISDYMNPSKYIEISKLKLTKTDNLVKGNDCKKLIKSKPKLTKFEQIRCIKDLLKQADLAGNSWVSGEMDVFTLIYIQGYDYQSIPLKQLEKSLIFQSGDYLVSENIYEIPADKIEIQSLNWNELISSISVRLAKEMGCVGEIRAELDKMILYDKGACIRKQEHAIRDARIFGKLMIQLPTMYTGGEFKFYERNEAKSYKFGQEDGKIANLLHYIAYCDDLEHEMSVITSGFSQFLVYNLYWSSGNGKLINKNDLIGQMEEVLDSFNSTASILGMVLSEDYDYNLILNKGINALNEFDFKRFELLKQANESLMPDKQMTFHIAHLKFTIYNQNEEDNDSYMKKLIKISTKSKKKTKVSLSLSPINRLLEITEVISLDGKACYNKNELKIDDFTQIFDLNKADLDQELDLNDRNQWTFVNSSQENKTVYDKYVLIFASKSIEKCFDMAKDTDKEAINLKLNNLIDKIKKIKHEPAKLINEYVDEIVDLFIKSKDLSQIQMFIDSIVYDYGNTSSLARLIQEFGWSFSNNYFNKLTQPLTKVNFKINCGLVKALVELNENEKAYLCFKDCVEPIFDCMEMLEIKDKNFEMYYDLLGVIILFEKCQDFDMLMDKYRNMIIKFLNQDDYKFFFFGMKKNVYSYRNYNQVMDLLRYRADHLTKLIDFIEDENKFSMFEACNIECDMKPDLCKDIYNFIISDKEVISFPGRFELKKHAVEFVSKLKEKYKSKNYEHGFSVKYDYNGNRKETVLIVIKTDSYRKYKLKKIEEFKSELVELNSILMK